MPRGRGVMVQEREHGLPFSKGLFAHSIMVSGLSPLRAYHVAERLEEKLRALGKTAVSRAELRALAVETIKEEAGERYAENYLKWEEVADLELPLIILIGGATGVGKSTLATHLAARLGIVRIVATDSIREVMRALFSRALMPTLYASSFEAGKYLREVPRAADPVLVGFREQVAAVAVGVRAVLERAVKEGLDVIIEGAHVVPGFVDPPPEAEAVVVPLVMTVDDEELHRSHFILRTHETRTRPPERYLAHFAEIRKIQKYIKSMALKHGTPVVPSYNLDATLATVIELVVEKARSAAAARGRIVERRAEGA